MLPGGDPMPNRLIAILCLSALVLSPAATVFAQNAPVTHVSPAAQTPASQTAGSSAAASSSDTYYRSAPCSEAIIRSAAAKKVAPPLVGCPVAGTYQPLLQFFLIVPRVHKTDSTVPAGQILNQSPAAGAPLDKAGKLSFDVSTGTPPPEKPAASTEVPATSAAPEKPPVSSAAPVEPMAPASPAAPSSEDASSESSAPGLATPPPLTDERIVFKESFLDDVLAFPMVLLVGLGVFAVAITGLIMNGRKTGRKSSKALPHVSCEATFGPGRVVRRGPLVLGEKGDR